MRIFLRTLFYLIVLAGTGCSLFSGSCCSQGRLDLLNECWMQRMNKDPNVWLRGADRWFLNGSQNEIEWINRHASRSAGITFSKVKSPCFDKVFVQGNFQVQIIGGQPYNHITLLGPNSMTRLIAVDFCNGTLILRQIKLTKGSRQPMLNLAIVRICIGQLNYLGHSGCGTILGRCIYSPHLTISSCGRGNIMLVGKMNVEQIKKTGKGCISLFGACTPCLRLCVLGPGSVNLIGRIGIQSLTHIGNGCVNIIGADSDGLSILTDGYGVTALSGHTNVRKIVAKGHSQVLLDCATSASACIAESGCAAVGIAGYTQDLQLNLRGGARFWGSYFRSHDAYVKISGNAHANIRASHKLFARGTNASSIYFYGPAGAIAKNITGNALLIRLDSPK